MNEIIKGIDYGGGLHEEFTRKILTPLKLKLNIGEIYTINLALTEYISFMFSRSEEQYQSRLDCNSDIYSAYTLYRRLFNVALKRRDSYTVSLNSIELAIVQRVLYSYLEAYEESTNVAVRQRLMGVRLLYGKIHQKTV